MKLIYQSGKSGRTGAVLPSLDVPQSSAVPSVLRRSSTAGLPEVSELEAVRHFTNLSRMNMSVDTHFYPLGSCTMKYNPKFHEKVVRMAGFAELHPLLPQLRHGGTLTQGALTVIYETERMLSDILGFAQTTMQPMAGSHGELTGVMLIAAYHKARKDFARKIMLIPDAAHGTNPASATVAGYTTKVVLSDPDGNVDLAALKELLSPEVAGIMLTCPNTLGLFDPHVGEICSLVHGAGGLCYCDGANFNAIVGRLRPGDIGFDVMHVNIHKTFSTPHGGGGPGSGPVGVSEKLVPFLPVSRVVRRNDGTCALEYNYPESIGYIAPFYGNFGIILRAYAYLLTLGRKGLVRVSENAVINANYIAAALDGVYDRKYKRTCMHECVFSAAKQVEHGVHALDIAKALIDRGIHPPTIYFPLIVPEALMIEPTETESREELDLFISVMKEIAEQAEKDPERVKECPLTTPVKRLDETSAARKPDLCCP